MIDKKVIINLAKKTGIKAETLEKDYAMNLILDAFCHCPSTSNTIFFKGGCCVHKCFSGFKPEMREGKMADPYFLTGRFSSDIDVTVRPELMDEKKLLDAFSEVAEYLKERHGLIIDQFHFPLHHNEKQNKVNCRGSIHFQGPIYANSSKKGFHNSPFLKFDITADERVVFEPHKRPIYHPYSRGGGEEAVLMARTYTFRDMFAEKLRALFERCSPRDLYDLSVFMRQPEAETRKLGIGLSIIQKFEYKKIPLVLTEDELMRPRGEANNGMSLKNKCQEDWNKSLSRQVIELPSFEKSWNSVGKILDYANECLSMARRHQELSGNKNIYDLMAQVPSAPTPWLDAYRNTRVTR